MTVDRRVFDAVELIAASTWATEAVLRAIERGELDDARALLDDARRPLRRGLRDLRLALEQTGDENGDAVARDGVVRLEELMERRRSA